MPSGAHAEGKAGNRARVGGRSLEMWLNGGPRPPMGRPAGLDWFAKHLEPREWAEIEHELEHVGDVEALIGSVSHSSGGSTCQLQVLPAYVHQVVDLTQRSSQGVLVARFYMAPFNLFAIDGDPAWDDPDAEDTSADDE